MRFFADLHVHSHYSRATSKEADINGLYTWASKKGIQVVGTGDFTHPAWLEELEAGLEETEPGLYMPKNAKDLDAQLPQSCQIQPRFLLSVEISSIYKKAGRVRKVHTVVLMPDLASARAFHAALDKLGNVRSDGRPILGLDPKEILKIARSIHGDCEVIPAHIWTPWFSTLGERSGFDNLEECYEEELEHIHALETGLSSDPTMNYRVSALDRYTLVSHSDAHSPAKLGREADILDTPLSYHAIVQAIRRPAQGFVGTVEFYPEEGKYHFDGHRKCGVVLTPEEAAQNNNTCPVCGKPLTMGVMHRVLDLADRGPTHRPAGKPLEVHQIPLPEVLGELYSVGAQSKRVAKAYERLLAASGPELPLLLDMPLEAIEEVTPTLREAIRRIRAEHVYKQPGYDGVFGRIQVFRPGELDSLRNQGLLVGFGDVPATSKPRRTEPAAGENAVQIEFEQDDRYWKRDLTPAQLQAINCRGNCAVIAGPGSGKTFVLTTRVRRLLEQGTRPAEILAVTFTTAAAIEIRERIASGHNGAMPRVMTMHAFGRELARQMWPKRRLIDQRQQLLLLKDALRLSLTEARKCIGEIALFKAGRGERPRCFDAYEQALARADAMDMDDLIWRVVRALEQDDSLLRDQGIRFLLVDEVQDINPVQAQMIVQVHKAGAEVFLIGDPEQAIYGFRGAMPDAVEQLASRIGGMDVMGLDWSFRLTHELARFAGPLRSDGQVPMTGKHGPRPQYLEFRTPLQEAIFIAKEIASLLGGLDMIKQGQDVMALEDIAVLGRTRRVLNRVKEALQTEGIPFVEGSQADDEGFDSIAVMQAFLRAWQAGEPPLNKAMIEHLNKQGIEDLSGFQRVAKLIGQHRPDEPGALDTVWEQVNRAMEAEGMLTLPDMNVLSSQPDIVSMLDALTLMKKVDALNLSDIGVRLLTIHGAKGLEFGAVFVVGVQDGLLPFDRAHTREELAEERRLLHVAVTRASGRLYMTSVKNRDVPGLNVRPGKSSLLSMVPAGTFEDKTVHVPKRKRKKDVEQLELF